MVEMNQKQIDFLIKMMAKTMAAYSRNPLAEERAEEYIKERFYALSGDVE